MDAAGLTPLHVAATCAEVQTRLCDNQRLINHKPRDPRWTCTPVNVPLAKAPFKWLQLQSEFIRTLTRARGGKSVLAMGAGRTGEINAALSLEPELFFEIIVATKAQFQLLLQYCPKLLCPNHSFKT